MRDGFISTGCLRFAQGDVMQGFVRAMVLSVAFSLLACQAALADQPEANGNSGCAGEVGLPPPGLNEVQDPGLLAQAIGRPMQGKLCTGKVFRVTGYSGAQVQVYRVWDASKPYTAYGSWWSFDPPLGPRDVYRQANEICPAWSALNKVSRCTVKVGAEIVVGPGQSAVCDNALSYPVSPVNQVFIPNDLNHDQLAVENCTVEGDWP
jgi:hypothetical protein